MLLITVASALLGYTTIQAPAPRAGDTARVVGPAPVARSVTGKDSASPAARTKVRTATRAPGKVAEPVARQDVDAIIARAVAAWKKVHTLRATFEQTVVNPITGSSLKARGELQQRKPSHLAIRFTDPEGDRIVADGKHVWIFLPSATPGQVIRMSNAEAGAANTDLIGQFLTTPRARYEARDAGVDTVGGRAVHAVVLLAKAGESLPFVRAKVWVDARDGLIRQFESTDNNGVTRHVRLLTMSPNATVASAAFRFDVPPGVRIVEP